MSGTRRARPITLSAIALVTMLLAACAPGAPSRTEPASAPGSAPGSAPAPTVRKTFTLTMQDEPVAFIRNLHTNIQGDIGREAQYIFHNSLFVELEYETYHPQLAAELPSFENGTWRLNPDGTMDTVWKLRPGVKWHDGVPFTSADLMFTYELNKDIELTPLTSATTRMASASAPDDLTFIVHWSAPYAVADRDTLPEIAPQHLLEAPYRANKATFLGDSHFTDDFIGLGPYRLTTWAHGAYIEATRFDDYYQGRPKLDSLVIRFARDPNAAIASILSGGVDMVSSSSSAGIDLDAALEVQRRWEGTGNQVIANQTGRVFVAEPQFRPEFTRPANGVSNLAVRQALYHAVDRKTLSEVMTHSLSPTADSYFLPFDPLRPQMESFIPQYPFDPARARQLMADAGWTPGPDGVLVNGASGARFDLEIRGRQGAGNDKTISIIADGWKATGVAAVELIEPTALLADRSYESTRSGFLIVGPSGSAFYEGVAKEHTRSIPTAENGWRGSNYGAYSNPHLDELIDRLQEAIDPRDRLPLHQQLVYEHMANVVTLPLYWQVVPELLLKGVSGPRTSQKRTTTNIFEWDKA